MDYDPYLLLEFIQEQQHLKEKYLKDYNAADLSQRIHTVLFFFYHK